jgi:hypothetical protein
MAEALDIPISKVRRNTKEFLGDDPRAARRAGVRREFSLNDGFFVFLGGELVTNHNLSFGNARRALDVIKPWLLKNQLVPEPPKGSYRRGVDAGEPMIDEHTPTDDIYKKIESGEIALDPWVQAPNPRGDADVTTEFYVMPRLSEGRIIEICAVRIVVATDIHENVDSIGRKYNWRHAEEYYYFFRNNHGKLDYFLPTNLGTGMHIKMGVENKEIDRLWKRSKPIGEIPISKMFSDYIRSITSVI